jgi:hypothetical protein
MSDWVVTALVGLGNDPQEAEVISEVFRSIRSMREPDALQVFLGLIAEMGNQAEAKIATAQESADRMAAAHLERCEKVRELQVEVDKLWVRDAQWVEKWKAALDLRDGPTERANAAEAALAAAREHAAAADARAAAAGLEAEKLRGLLDRLLPYVSELRNESGEYYELARSRLIAETRAALAGAQAGAVDGKAAGT